MSHDLTSQPFCGEEPKFSGWMCYGLHSIPDLAIAIAYFSIPCQLLYFLNRFPLRLSRIYKIVIGLFAGFIFSCGATHIFNILKLNSNFPGVLIGMKVFTALISLITSVILFRVIPEMLKLPVHASALESELSMRLIELNTAKTRVEATDRSKTEFMAFLCHELRNPLHIITSQGEFLTESKLTGEQYEYVRVIDTMTRLMTSIVNDVLDMSKLESGRMRLESVTFDVHSLCTTLMTTAQSLARNKALILSATISDDVPRYAVGDSGRLHQVLLTLVSNAIKFTPRGEVALRVQLAAQQQTPDEPIVEFIVHDTGIGMPHDFIPLLFTPYNQAKLSTVRETGGTGLGLSIAKRIIELMHGIIKVSSKVGEGSTFTLAVPFRCGLPALLGNAIDAPLAGAGGADDDTHHPLLMNGHHAPGTPGGSGHSNGFHVHHDGNGHGGQHGHGDHFDPVLSLNASHESVQYRDNYTLPTPPLGAHNANVTTTTIDHIIMLPPPLSTHSGSSSSSSTPVIVTPPISGGRIMALNTGSNGNSNGHGHHARGSGGSASPSPLGSARSIATTGTPGTTTGSGTASGSGSNGEIVLPPTGVALDRVPSNNEPTIANMPALVSPTPVVTRTMTGMNNNMMTMTLDSSGVTNSSGSNGTNSSNGSGANTPTTRGGHNSNNGLRILVVDDNIMNQKLLVHHMHALGLDTGVAADGLQAVTQVKQQPNEYDLVFMDLCMPVMSGTRATMQLRHMGYNRPIIALTANAQPEDRAEALSAGCNEFVTKPIRRQQLATLIARFLPTWREPAGGIVASPGPTTHTIASSASSIAVVPSSSSSLSIASSSMNDVRVTTVSGSGGSIAISPNMRKKRPVALTATGNGVSSTLISPTHATSTVVTTNGMPPGFLSSPVPTMRSTTTTGLASSSTGGAPVATATYNGNVATNARRTPSSGSDDFVLHIRAEPSVTSVTTSHDNTHTNGDHVAVSTISPPSALDIPNNSPSSANNPTTSVNVSPSESTALLPTLGSSSSPSASTAATNIAASTAATSSQ